jgi:hypothetical protein
MSSSRCRRNLLRAAVVALVASVCTVSVGLAKPREPKKPGFRLFASAFEIFQNNRVVCGVGSDGEICITPGAVAGGGFWPRGSFDQYIFASGMQIGGIVDPTLPKSQNGFAGDTAGAFFYNTSTGSGNGVEVQKILSSANPVDVASWPDQALVPQGDATEELFDPSLRGTIAASQADHWFVSWEGDPGNLTFRSHPLGILVETRTLAWNFPSGNEDILYLLFTFYNVTSANPAAYTSIRPSLRPLIEQKGKDFVALNVAKYGISLPDTGYTIKDIFVDVVMDNDVSQADVNYATVNVPFSLGVTYEHSFSASIARANNWTFDPSIFGTPPFFEGPGFIGAKYLRSPIDPLTGKEVGLTVFGTFSRQSGALQDPSDDRQLYRYMSGGLLPTDGACSVPDLQVNHICFVNIGSPADMRFFESSGPFDLAPGQFGTVVVAYVFAAPVSAGGCPGTGCDVKPASSSADLTILGDPARMAGGVNTIDSIMGYKGFTNAGVNDADPTRVTQDEFLVQPGSLLAKALVAQSVFNNKFLLPFAPEKPEFFLVPGDNQVTVLWSISPNDLNAPNPRPDAFFAVASQPILNGVVNPLYDPNFRDFDVEGYRIYRGRTSSPSELTMVAQFDNNNTIFQDFRGTVNPTPQCAPELGLNFKADCSVVFDTLVPGQPLVVHRDFNLTGAITQVKPGDRVLLATGTAQILPGKEDTLFADINKSSKFAAAVTTELKNTGIPFIFVDKDVRNSLRYFYAVTAFDVNSATSGPSSLESARAVKPVTPTPSPSNLESQATIAAHVIGRGVATDTVIKQAPTIDPATGTFSGPAQPANGGIVEFVGEFAKSVIQPDQSGEVSMRLDSIQIGQLETQAGFASGSLGFPTIYHLTVKNPTDSFALSAAVNQLSAGFVTGPLVEADTTLFTAITVEPQIATKFEGSPPFKIFAQAVLQTPDVGLNGGWGAGCRGGDFGTLATCFYNGDRWFDGPSPAKNETKADPNGGNCSPNSGGSTALLAATGTCNLAAMNNAGALTGVDSIQQALSYVMMQGKWRNFDWLFPTVHRGADYNVYWGDNGAVDSIIDVSHNVPVPFSPSFGSSWGILNTSDPGLAGGFDTRPAVLTLTDLGCVEPAKSQYSPGIDLRVPCSGSAAQLSSTAVLGSVAFFKDDPANAQSAPVSGTGFVFYLVGSAFLMQTSVLPAKGTVWTLRAYAGAITGGKGPGGGDTKQPYRFTPAVSPFTAVGATVATQFSIVSNLVAASKNDLSQVHTVPDPYYVESKFEVSTEAKVLKFVGLPQDCIIRIYSISGVLVRVLEHHAGNYSSSSTTQGSEHDWDLKNRNNQVVASGVYFWHVEAGDARRVGRFTVVNFAK